MTLLLILGAALILVIAGMLVRIQTLVDVMRGSFYKRAGASNRINAILFVVFLFVGLVLFAWITVWSEKYYLPEPSSAHGKDIDNMFWVTMAIITFVFIATHLLLFTFPYRFQFREDRKATFYPDNHKLELIWTVIPAIVLSMLVFSGWKVWTEVTAPAPENKVTLEIVGKQFNWIVRYPGSDGQLGKYNFRMIDAVNSLGMDFNDQATFDDFMPNEIHIPVGVPVEFKIRSRDVLHSVFAMHFRQKMDAVPGMPTTFWFTPTKTTAEMREETGNQNFNYEIACTEVCGRGHFGMRMLIVVDEPEEYQKWLASQSSFLNKNPDYLARVPENLKELARKQLPAEPTQAPSTASTSEPAAPQNATPAPAAAPAENNGQQQSVTAKAGF